MRYVIPAAFAVLIPQASLAGPPPQAPTVTEPAAIASAWSATGQECRKAEAAKAESGPAWRDTPVTPKKLTDLPDANSYMAVFRTVDGCEVPMSVVEYRSGQTR
ncbi:hypothetical protein H8M03_06760 [Sphingomonas sabuli]|uniref:Uncharacterized protein n=1 Tax=Sphingomonas sabuli TaxID=2764186 RepID=A0A7G9KZH0_9SPHN|nr:hypothetical protein [Sphingomonas sabuli]QNM81769.1 hypothetical protein H8M03_06760 [Sphingomonas sabuli]